jgi:geranylgeranyl diphosphate synthase type 3
MSVVNKLT